MRAILTCQTVVILCTWTISCCCSSGGLNVVLGFVARPNTNGVHSTRRNNNNKSVSFKATNGGKGGRNVAAFQSLVAKRRVLDSCSSGSSKVCLSAVLQEERQQQHQEPSISKSSFSSSLDPHPHHKESISDGISSVPMDEKIATNHQRSLQEIAQVLANDLVYGSNGRGGYFVSGDFNPEMFHKDCLFVDPTNSVRTLDRYRKKLMFDPSASIVEMMEQPMVDEASRTITVRIRACGRLRLPWNPVIPPYESEVVYHIDENNLIDKQTQTWSISAAEALKWSITPGFFAPTPSSVPSLGGDEPPDVTRLFWLVNGRRPESYTEEEKAEIDMLIDRIVDGKYPWKREALPGTWMLSYVQPGPKGEGIDIRMPFFSLPCNDNLQNVVDDKVVNVGQVLGSAVEVRVSGPFRETDRSNRDTPKRFVAEINKGVMAFGSLPLGVGGGFCVPLHGVQGLGLSDGLYLGDRVRIGQNLNGGGARTVQLKVQ